MKWYGDAVKRQISASKEKALTEIGLLVEARAKLKAPVDTGNLRGSISSSVEQDYAEISTNVDYAVYVEYGHSKQAPEGYMRNSLHESRPDIIRIAGQIGSGLDG